MGEAQPFDDHIEDDVDLRFDFFAQYGLGDTVDSRWEPYNDTVEGSRTTHTIVIDELQSLLSGSEAILDAGCSNGKFDYRIRAETGHYGRLVGIDVDRLTLPVEDKMSRVGIRPIEFRQESVLKIKEPDNSFDVALSLFMLYHVPQYDRALAELRRILKPGGILFVATSQTGDTYDTDNKHMHRLFETRVAEALGVKPPPKFAATFGPNEAEASLARNGFRIVEREPQYDEMEVNDERTLRNYIASFLTMASACQPRVNPLDWMEKFEQLCLPEIKTAIEIYGSFRD